MLFLIDLGQGFRHGDPTAPARPYRATGWWYYQQGQGPSKGSAVGQAARPMHGLQIEGTIQMTDTYQAERLSVNDAVLATVKVHKHVVARWADMLKAWPKQAGVKPTQAMLMAAAMFSKKASKAEAGFIAMNLRAGGCSRAQLAMALNVGPANNHRKAVITAGYFKGELTNGQYTLEFTKKGEAYLGKRLSELEAHEALSGGKPAATAKPKATRKRKPKVEPVIEPVPVAPVEPVEIVPVPEPVTA